MIPRPAAVVAPIALLCATLAHAQLDCELNGQGVNPDNGSSIAGKTGLLRCKDRSSGELQRESQIQNGVAMGLVRIYEKGKLAREHSLNAKGNLQGRAREFSPTGRVLRDAAYDDGQERGLVRSFYPDGKLRRAIFYPTSDTGGGNERASVEFTEHGQLSEIGRAHV